MPLRRGKPVTLRPAGLSDSVDATNAFPGAMAQLVNLIPDPTTDKCWVCRPAATPVNGFPSSLQNPGFISGALVVGNILYGTIASALNPGFDQPFAFNLATNTFLTVNGITAANVPASPPTAGDWVPPIIAQVGSRIVVCHPGFPGGTIKFGWFDISGFSETTEGNPTSGSKIITGNPSILGVQPGMTIGGANIPAGATVISAAPFVLDTTGDTHGNTTIDNLATMTGIAVGQEVGGANIAPGTTVSVVGGSSITLNQAATGSASGQAITFSGATITMSENATGTATANPLLIQGGTATAPLWGAGDTNLNNLPSVPLGVAQFNGRAYYVLGTNGIVFSDSGLACQVSNNPNVQALLTNDGLACTAIGPLPLNTLLGGIVQALVVFEGATKMQQITGDPETSNLQMNALPMATGTLAPLSIVPCQLGLAFISPQGLRYVSFDGRVSNVVGAYGQGISAPFINAPHPSRICAAANVGVLRISAETNTPSGNPTVEYWYDLERKCWSGPHTFASSQIQAWASTFVCAQNGVTGQIFQSDAYQSSLSQFVENSATMAWLYQPTALPDNGDLAGNSLVDMALTCGLATNSTLTLNAFEMNGTQLDSTFLNVPGVTTTWGEFTWGQALWGGGSSPFQQRWVNWNEPLVFKQLTFQATGQSSASVRMGNLYMRYQVLGYILELAPPGPVPFYQLLSDQGVPLSSDPGNPEVGL